MVVISTQHVYAGFEPVAAEILYVHAQGAIPMTFEDLEFETYTQAYWPKVDDPYGV